ncbi:hypothetical protein ACTFIW_006460 [Dictyostelium discoideum]
MTHKKDKDNENLSEKLEIQNKEIKEIKLSIKEITRSIENVYQLLLTNRNLCSHCQQQKLNNSGNGINNTNNSNNNNLVNNNHVNNNNNNNNSNINSNSINNTINNNNNVINNSNGSSSNLLGTINNSISNSLNNHEQIKFLQRSKTFSQESDILTQTLTDRANYLNNSFQQIGNNGNRSPRNISQPPSPSSPSSLSSSYSSTSSSSYLIVNNNNNNSNNNNNNNNKNCNNSNNSSSSNNNNISNTPPKVPILHLKKDVSNPGLIKQWISDTVRIKADDKNVDEKIIKLDIGGKFYSTSLSTLTKYPNSMLGVMFSGRYELPRDKDGKVFIDRDGKLFGFILSYLRDGPLWIPPVDMDLKRRVEVEMSYFGLPSIQYTTQVGMSPMSTPRCVCDVKNQTLGQNSEHQGIWEEIKGMTTGIKSFRLLITMNNTLYAITERIHEQSNDINLNGNNNNANNNNSNNVNSSNNSIIINNNNSSSNNLLNCNISSNSSTNTSGNNSPSLSGGSSSVTIQFEEYNIRSNSWSYICPVLDSMTPHYFAAGVVGDSIYAFPDAGLQQSIFRYDAKEMKWKNTETKLPCGKTGFNLAVLDDYIYIIGGYKGSTVSDSVERYHPKSNSWCSVSNMLTKRAEGSTVIHDNNIYIIGGSIPNTTIERYNPHSNVWSFVCNLSNGQFKVSTAASIEGKIYAIGAENESYSNNIVLQFNPTTNSWKRVAPLLANSYNPHSSVVLDRFIYFIPWGGGGSNVHKYESCFC